MEIFLVIEPLFAHCAMQELNRIRTTKHSYLCHFWFLLVTTFFKKKHLLFAGPNLTLRVIWVNCLRPAPGRPLLLRPPSFLHRSLASQSPLGTGIILILDQIWILFKFNTSLLILASLFHTTEYVKCIVTVSTNFAYHIFAHHGFW